MSEEKTGNESEQKKKTLTPNETLLFAFSIIEEKAWISLGLIKDADGEFHKSKKDSKLLIDTLSKMAESFESQFDEKVLKDLKNQIANLQLNFVNQFKN